VTTAQVEAWVSTWKGSIDKANCDIDASFADAAFGRMMLHRRRAVAASVVSTFLARTGGGSAAYMEGGERAVLLDDVHERAIAAEAGGLVGKLYGASPAFLFERALLARAEGRFDDALSDLKQVVAAYPAFVAAATAAGKIALAAGDPAEAIHLLAAVERELTHTRDGAAVLADAAREIGLYQAASQYDLLALTCPGAYDSRGNDCTPFDLRGEIADDGRVPQTLYVEGQADHSVICNAGGIYYTVHPLVGYVLAAWTLPRALSITRSLGPSSPKRRIRKSAGTAVVPMARLRPFFRNYFPKASGRVRQYSARLMRVLRGPLVRAATLSTRVDLALGILVHGAYRRLPTSIRQYLNLTARTQLKRIRPVVRNSIGPVFGPRGNWGIFSRVPDAYAYGELARARYRSGVARIFGLPTPGPGNAAISGTGAFPVRRLFQSDEPSAGEVPLKMPPPRVLPPAAEDALNRLMSEAAIRRIAPPRS
jgi:tetratricopeptide (TPR) repeat protein